MDRAKTALGRKAALDEELRMREEERRAAIVNVGWCSRGDLLRRGLGNLVARDLLGFSDLWVKAPRCDDALQ
jgi:hypothetical protein